MTDWETVTVTPVSAIINSGSIVCKKRAGLCFVWFSGVTFKSSGDNKTIYTGLPKCTVQSSILFGGTSAAKNSQIVNAGDCTWIENGATTLKAHFGSTYGEAHYGTLIYPCD